MKLLLFTSYFGNALYDLQAEQLYSFLATFFASASLLFIFILYTRRIISTRDHRIDNLKFKYQYLIYEALVESRTENGANAQTLIVEKLKKEVAKTKLHKQVLIDLIIDLKKNFLGDAEKQFVRLYQDLHLFQYSFEKLKSSRWDVQAKGIRELTEMNPEDFDTQLAITKMRDARNHSVAEEAQIASIRLEKHPLSFLHDLEKPLTEWQQINLHHLLLKINKKPDFTQWLSSSNESVVLFALKMIADFEQKQSEFKVSQCLSHQSIRIREEALRTLLKLKPNTSELGVSAEIVNTDN